MANKDLYSVLGLQHGASIDEVKKAFKKLAIQYHPDKQQGKSDAEKKQAEDKFKEINEAYSILSDAKKKQEYDNFGSVGGGGMNMGGDFSDMADLIRNMHNSGMMGGFNPFDTDDGFNPFGGGGRQVIINGDDIRIKLDSSIEDIYNGATKTIKYSRKVKCHECNGTGSKSNEKTTCPHCHGTGMYTETKRISAFQVIQNTTTCPYCHGTGQMIKDPCRKCGGTGLEETKETVNIPIPIEVRNGAIVSMSGMGNMAPNNMGNPGDLLIKFTVRPHDRFTIAENNIDLECHVKVGVLDCITGCNVTVRTIKGTDVKVDIPVGIKDKQKLAVSGYGMPIGNGRFGNMIVIIDQVMPSKLNSDETEKLNDLKHSKNFK